MFNAIYAIDGNPQIILVNAERHDTHNLLFYITLPFLYSFLISYNLFFICF